MSPVGRTIRNILVAVTGILAITALGLWARSEMMLRKAYPSSGATFAIPADSPSIARGEHLTRIATCTLCHGTDLGGALYADMGPMGRIAGPNLTRGKGSVTASFTPADWHRAVRQGVRRDGRSLIVMPTEVFAHLTDGDLGAIVAYLNAAPPVDREVPPSGFGPLGRALLAAGKLDILVAPKTPRQVEASTAVPGPSREYGRYLADIVGCHGCHGHGLSGGRVAGPPDLPPASNITPRGLEGWTEADFAKALREGVRPDGNRLNEFMPYAQYAAMTDDEVRALWLYVTSVPPRDFGNK
jgi:cytochrome c553